MHVHHLNCVSACPFGVLRGRLTSHCLLLQMDRQLVLIDTGYGLRDVANPRSRLSKFFLALSRPELREEMTAARQIRQLGLDPRDVKHIVLSHLDFDHAGGLDDFPHAAVHLLADEIDAANARRTMLDRMRYRPQQWTTQSLWRGYSAARGEAWFGFECVRDLVGVGPEVLMVPLIGHTLGHAGVAVQRDNGWLLYTADAYFHHAEMDVDSPRCPPGLRAYQKMMEKDRHLRLLNQDRLRDLKGEEGENVEIFCAHDVVEFERLSGRSHRDPVGGEGRTPWRRGRPALATDT